MTLPLRIGVLAGASAPGIASLRDGGDLFELVVVAACAHPFAEERAIDAPVVYDEDDWAELFARFRVDYVVCYEPQFLTDAPLAAYDGRILALHDGDLMPFAGETRRRYAGAHAVREAILAGEAATRSSIYFATDRNADGPVALVSEPYAIAPLAADAIARGEWEPIAAYAEMHRDWMQRTAWGPLLRRFLELLAAGAVQRIGDTIWIDGVPAPCRLGEAPDACRHGDVRADVPASCPFIALK